MYKTAFLLLALPFGAVAAPAIFGAAYAGPTAPATLYSINSSTGAATSIGPIGFATVSAMDFAPNGGLYAIGLSGGSTGVLIQINPSTGAGTLVAPISGGRWAPGPAQDMAFRPSDGTLFAFQSGLLYTINITTGAATLVGSDAVGFPDGCGITFAGASLYLAGSQQLYTLNQNSGAATLGTAMTFAPAFGSSGPRFPAMKTDMTTGTIWGVVFSGSGSGSQASLGTLNPSTGAVTFIGSTQQGMDALALRAGGSGGAVIGVPALSTGALFLTAVLLLGMAWLAFLRPRSAER
jgi:hypothetical protein